MTKYSRRKFLGAGPARAPLSDGLTKAKLRAAPGRGRTPSCGTGRSTPWTRRFPRRGVRRQGTGASSPSWNDEVRNLASPGRRSSTRGDDSDSRIHRRPHHPTMGA